MKFRVPLRRRTALVSAPLVCAPSLPFPPAFGREGLFRRIGRSAFWREVFNHAESVGVPIAHVAEEVAAYAIEAREQVPPGIREAIDNFIGSLKAWALRRFGVQFGEVTPAQLHPLAVAALRSWRGESNPTTPPQSPFTPDHRAKISAVADAVNHIVRGANEAVARNLRPDLMQFGGDQNVHFVYGNSKMGLAHIGTKRDGFVLTGVLRSVAIGDDVRYISGKKTVRISHDGFTAVLSLDEHGKTKTWLLTGWEDGRPDARVEVGAQYQATQPAPTFSRDELGADLKNILREDASNGKGIRYSMQGNRMSFV